MNKRENLLTCTTNISAEPRGLYIGWTAWGGSEFPTTREV